MTDPVANIIERSIALEELKALVNLVNRKYGEDCNNIPKEDLVFLTELFKIFRQQYGKGMKVQPMKSIRLMVIEEPELAFTF